MASGYETDAIRAAHIRQYVRLDLNWETAHMYRYEWTRGSIASWLSMLNRSLMVWLIDGLGLASCRIGPESGGNHPEI